MSKLKTGENHNNSNMTSIDKCISVPKLRWGLKGTNTIRPRTLGYNAEGEEECKHRISWILVLVWGFLKLLLARMQVLFLEVLKMKMMRTEEAGLWRGTGNFPLGKPENTHSPI